MPVRLTLLALGLLAYAATQQQPPTIRSGVELVMVDVQVTGRDGTPVAGLKPEQFEVYIDGSRRAVATLSLVQHIITETARAGSKAATPAAPDPVVIPQVRTIIIGVDQASFQIVNEPAAREAVTRLLAMTAPADEIGIVGYPGPGPRVAPTRDRKAILAALEKINGQLQVWRPRLNISLAEAVDITAGDVFTIAQVRERECVRLRGDCGTTGIQQVAKEIASTYEQAAVRSINGLHSLVEAVKEYPGRKTLILVSAGLASTDRIGGRPDIRFEAEMLGLRAAEANATEATPRLAMAAFSSSGWIVLQASRVEASSRSTPVPMPP